MILIHNVEQGTPEWHALRKGLYTGSVAWKLLSYGPGDYALAEGSSFKGNFYTRRGHTLEVEAIELYEAINRCHVNRPGFVTNTLYPKAGFSPDGLREDRGIECKAFNEKLHMKMFNGVIDIKVLAQCYFGMLICGKRLWDLIIYNPDVEAKYAYKAITIKWNPAIAANLKRRLAA